MSKTEKEKERLEKKLSSILSAASSAKAWSDLLPITKDILQLLAKKTDVVNFSKLSNKLLLAKRLAQCLNPECPSGVHEVVLDIYYLILHNIVFHNETCLMDVVYFLFIHMLLLIIKRNLLIKLFMDVFYVLDQMN